MNLEEIKNDWLGYHPDIDLLIAEVKRLRTRAEKAEAELVEAEIEIHIRAAGEVKEWERAEKLKAENRRLQERVGELEEFVSDVWFYADRTFLFQRAGELLQKYDIHIPAQAQTKEGER